MVEKTVSMAQFAEHASFPIGNAGVVAVVVIPVLVPSVDKNHVVFMEFF